MSRVQTTGQTEVTSDWQAVHNPSGANTLATATQAARAGQRLVCTGLTVAFCAGPTAPTAICLSATLSDEDGNVLWACRFALPATAGASTGAVKNTCYFAAKAIGKSLTLAFSVAGGLQTFQSVSMEGLTVAG